MKSEVGEFGVTVKLTSVLAPAARYPMYVFEGVRVTSFPVASRMTFFASLSRGLEICTLIVSFTPWVNASGWSVTVMTRGLLSTFTGVLEYMPLPATKLKEKDG